MCSLLTQILSSSPETYSSQIETDVGDSQNCGRYFRNKRDCELEPDLEIWEATTRWQMQPTVSQLTLTSSYQPQFSNTSKHTCTQIFLPSFLPTDRPLCSYTQKFLHNYLDAAANHLLPSFFLRALSLSLSLTIAKTDPLASTKKLFSQNRRNLSKPQPTQECLYPLFSPTPSLHEKKTAHLAHPLGPQTSLAHNS